MRLVAILPWFAALFAAIAAAVLTRAASSAAASSTDAEPVTPTDTEEMVEKNNDRDVKA